MMTRNKWLRLSKGSCIILGHQCSNNDPEPWHEVRRTNRCDVFSQNSKYALQEMVTHLLAKMQLSECYWNFYFGVHFCTFGVHTYICLLAKKLECDSSGSTSSYVSLASFNRIDETSRGRRTFWHIVLAGRGPGKNTKRCRVWEKLQVLTGLVSGGFCVGESLRLGFCFRRLAEGRSALDCICRKKIAATWVAASRREVFVQGKEKWQ